MLNEIVRIDSRGSNCTDLLSPFTYTKTCHNGNIFVSPIHCFCAIVEARRRRAAYVDNDLWNGMSIDSAYRRMVSNFGARKARLLAQDYITTMMTSLWCMLMTNPRNLIVLLETGKATIVHVYPAIGPWSGSSTLPIVGANLVGFCMMVLRDRYRSGETMLSVNGYSNAAAVASMHLTQMPGVALPDLAANFSPSHFPKLSKMPATATPVVSMGESIRIADASSFNGIRVETPDISESETTSDFTRSRNASARHWKVSPAFIQGTKKAATLRFANVRIPCVKDKTGKYGNSSGYVYASFDGFIRDNLVKLIGSVVTNPIVTEENRVYSTAQHWWRIMNNLDKTIGTLDKNTEFEAKNLRAIMDRTNKGVVVNGEFTIQLKATTTDGSDFSSSTPVTISIDIVRVYINNAASEVELPQRERTAQTTVATRPIKAEVTPDDVMSQLRNLGL